MVPVLELKENPDDRYAQACRENCVREFTSFFVLYPDLIGMLLHLHRSVQPDPLKQLFRIIGRRVMRPGASVAGVNTTLRRVDAYLLTGKWTIDEVAGLVLECLVEMYLARRIVQGLQRAVTLWTDGKQTPKTASNIDIGHLAHGQVTAEFYECKCHPDTLLDKDKQIKLLLDMKRHLSALGWTVHCSIPLLAHEQFGAEQYFSKRKALAGLQPIGRDKLAALAVSPTV